jgi:hypothetical protein
MQSSVITNFNMLKNPNSINECLETGCKYTSINYVIAKFTQSLSFFYFKAKSDYYTDCASYLVSYKCKKNDVSVDCTTLTKTVTLDSVNSKCLNVVKQVLKKDLIQRYIL